MICLKIAQPQSIYIWNVLENMRGATDLKHISICFTFFRHCSHQSEDNNCQLVKRLLENNFFLFWERTFFISSLLRVEKEADEGGTLHAMANKSFVITSILVEDPHIIIITITSILAKDQSITMTCTMHRTRHIRCWWSRRRSCQATPGAQSHPAHKL